MNKISNFLSKISKKTKITILVITLIVLGITVLYQTFAISSNISGGSDNYTVTLNNNSIVTVPANGHKTVYFKIRNNNKGTVQYGVGYKGTNITVKAYADSESPSTGTITESESKFIKLYIENTSTSNSLVELISILGYVNGGELIVPSGYTLVNTEGSKAANTLKILRELNGSIELDNNGTPDFSTSAGESGDGTSGLYVSDDDLGTTYYFRGNVDNNYVYFANFYWRIIRINGDGTIRMIYAGTEPHENGYTDYELANTVIIKNGFAFNNSDSETDNTYFGYMTGTVGASTYTETHSNISDSTIKTVIDTWYKENLIGYDSYIADTIYCNDRSVYDGTGIGSEGTSYDYIRRINTQTPTLKCTNKNDRFTVNSTIGNSKLTYPIGLPTADEVWMSGVNGDSSSPSSYIENGISFWTMTPCELSSSTYITIYSGSQGMSAMISYAQAYEGAPNGIRPVISVYSSRLSGGSGTMDDPFNIG